MKHKIKKAVRQAQSLDRVYEAVMGVVLEEIKGKSTKKVGYVAGILTSDGPAYFKRNLRLLGIYTRKVQKQYQIPVLSSTEIFTSELFSRLDRNGHKNQDYEDMLVRILESGVITDLFMTPRWEASKGSKREHEVAKQRGITVHYLY